ncbi:type II toxin-antitoxin system HicB family antitoxin [Secundilactobacillus kimchicus]|uniref:type II toxin-antitoxin system HicB family antitoxin n=1 Tax=Secundilactobacillus kimchicus TaxID=528209 RepID=UPI001C0218F5|nr:type II toxin-antitoxin system HicB family antitoxin [Secundilactobacillus kimchicus]MBT9670479.1 type II toxin-antitoxin system HicB family antitoxin [Secundilactobacillus kimchicus]
MLIVYPATFYYTPDNKVKYFVHFPNFEDSVIEGDTITEVLEKASSYLGTTLANLVEHGKELPEPLEVTALDLTRDDPFADDSGFLNEADLTKSFVSLVSVDLKDYLDSDKPIKKTLTIPKWVDAIGKKKKINFSQILTEAILRLK